MKALSLWQPWATLVALGVKKLETRSWSTTYRGPLAIHATATMPKGMDGTAGMIGDYSVDRDGRSEPWYVLDRRDVGASHYQLPIYLPLGAVVATCVLSDVVPIVDDDTCMWDSDNPRDVLPSAHAAIDGQVILHQPDNPRYHTTVLVEQAYGDYTPGRFAWVLTDIDPVEPPVPARGRQQLWTWEPPE
jgi:hypothetical protein